MAQSKRIIVNDLDFDSIKNNLKEFLKAQDKFSDYNFEGSGLSILLDVLAYNTHYNAIYNNLTINELFLDSARKRSSVVSRATELGYTPNSCRSSRAAVQITVINSTTQNTNLTLPRYTPFNTTVDGKTYTFYTFENITSNIRQGDVFVFDNVEIIQGTPLTYRYSVLPGSKFIIPNQNVDISTLRVRVQDSANSDNFTSFNPETSILNVQRDSNVYYIKEIDNGLYEIEFGDGITSTGVESGNVVHLEYFVSNKEEPNGAKIFSYQGDNIGSSVQLVTLSPAAGGTEQESIESIKRNTPRFRASQNRAVVIDDYKALILNNFPEIETLTVWGGEDNSPPIYGKVFICARPTGFEKLTLKQKSDIISFLRSRNVIPITPEIIDPEYIKIQLNVTAYYNQRNTIKTTRDIIDEVTRTIQTYNAENLQRFESIFRYSRLSRLIDESDPSIVNNITRVSISRRIEPRYNINARYTINIINPIHSEGLAEESVKTTNFYIAGSESLHYIDDDGKGKLRLIRVSGNSSQPNTVVNTNAGTVNYANGFIQIENLNITSIQGPELNIMITPSSNDVVSVFTQIAEIDEDNLVVNAIADNTVNGDVRAGKNYVFTPSRM